MDRLGPLRILITTAALCSSLVAIGCGSSAEFRKFEKEFQSLYGTLSSIDRQTIDFCEARKHFVEWQDFEDRVYEQKPQSNDEIVFFAHIVEARRVAGGIFAKSFERGMRKASLFHCEGSALSDSDFIWEGTRALKAYWPQPLGYIEVQGLQNLFLEARKREIYDLSMEYGNPNLRQEDRDRILTKLKFLLKDTLDKNYIGKDLEEEFAMVENLSK